MQICKYKGQHKFPFHIKPLNEQQTAAATAELSAKYAAVVLRPDTPVPADDAAAKRHVPAAVHVPADAAEPAELPVGLPAGLQPGAATTVRPDAEYAVRSANAAGTAADAGLATGTDPTPAVPGPGSANSYSEPVAAATSVGTDPFSSGARPDTDVDCPTG